MKLPEAYHWPAQTNRSIHVREQKTKRNTHFTLLIICALFCWTTNATTLTPFVAKRLKSMLPLSMKEEVEERHC